MGTNMTIGNDSIELTDELPYTDDDICYQQTIMYDDEGEFIVKDKSPRGLRKGFSGKAFNYRMSSANEETAKTIQYSIRDEADEANFVWAAAKVGFFENEEPVWITTRAIGRGQRKIIAVHKKRPGHTTEWRT